MLTCRLMPWGYDDRADILYEDINIVSWGRITIHELDVIDRASVKEASV